VLPPAPDSGVAAVDENAPTPYTADQIRAACPVGRVIPFRVEMAGKPTILHVMKFVTADDKGADVESVNKDEKGTALGPPETQHATWEELRQHAQFPRAVTRIEDGVADTPAGKFPSKVYIVRNHDELSTFYFAVDRPGPPVLFFTEQNGQRIRTSTLVEPPQAAIACKTDDDCWMDDKYKPIARPKEQRGKKIKPCKDGEHAPVCRENACTVVAYKC
jgi:hypothetical protein